MSGVLLEDLARVVEEVMLWPAGRPLAESGTWELLQIEADSAEMRQLIARAESPDWSAADAARLVGLVAEASALAEFQHLKVLSALTIDDLDWDAWALDAYSKASNGERVAKKWIKPSERLRRRQVVEANRSRAKMLKASIIEEFKRALKTFPDSAPREQLGKMRRKRAGSPAYSSLTEDEKKTARAILREEGLYP